MSENLTIIKTYYIEAFRAFDKNNLPPEISVEFYPYIGISHKIRRRNERIFVKLAEICRDMPFDAHRALAFILVAKLLQKKVPGNARAVYSEFVKSVEMQQKAHENRQQRGKKIITSAKGKFYDLDGIFEKINLLYFANKIAKPTLSWSRHRTYRILGHHDAVHQTIIISRSLDDLSVPKFVVEYIVFHEMLHIFYPTQIINGRRRHHTPEFRRHERKFMYFLEAEEWIEQNAQVLRKKALRK